MKAHPIRYSFHRSSSSIPFFTGSLTALVLLLTEASRAASGTWGNSAGGSWPTTSDWVGGVVASGADATADFSSLNLTSDAIVTLDGARTIGNVIFGDSTPGNNWILNTGTAGLLTFSVSSGIPAITVTNQTATLGVILSGTSGLTKNGAGTLVFSSANGYTGPTIINSGTLRVTAAPLPSGSLTIMPLGDSITYGSGGTNAGYRGPLYLLAPLASGFQYVGSSALGAGSLPSSPIDEQHHEGHPSYHTREINANLDGYDNTPFNLNPTASRDANGGYWLVGGNGTGRSAIFPDIILLMIGTNDLSHTPSVQESELDALLSKITTLRPATHLIVAKIVPSTARANVDSYNVIVSKLAASYQAAGKLVTLVDLNTNFPANGLGSDGVHPNSTGYNWMANQSRDAIVALSGTAIPTNSPVTVQGGARLEMNGQQVTLTSLSGAGTVTLGTGGGKLTLSNTTDSTFSGPISGAGSVIKTGSGILTLSGSSNYSGSAEVNGGTLRVTGSISNGGAIDVLNGATLEMVGGNIAGTTIHIHSGAILRGSGVIAGSVVNDGTILVDSGQTLAFSGSVTNNGLTQATGGAALTATGTFTNQGTLDIMTGAQSLPPQLVNTGRVLTAGDVKMESFSVGSGQVTLTIQSYNGHNYQLRYTPSLLPASWENVGSAKAGDGSILSVMHANSTPTGFYRMEISP